MKARAEATISADLARVLIRGSGLPIDKLRDLLDAAGIDPELVQRTQQRIAAESFQALWTAMEQVADDPFFGLHLGEARGGLPLGHVVFAAMLNSATMLQALQRYCRYHDLMADLLRPSLAVDQTMALLTVQSIQPGLRPGRQQVECVASLTVSVIRHLADGTFDGEVRFAHPAPADDSEHRRVLGPRVRFAQSEDGIALDRALVERPIACADPELAGVLDRHAEGLLRAVRPSRPWTGRVARAISAALCDGTPTLAEIAAVLDRSARTVQHKLHGEGTSFQALLDQIRKDLAISYLTTSTMPSAEIAFLLGYADQTAFGRAFKRWTGQSPLELRHRGPS
jgi:AraC-like DNA-binding protein